MMVRCITLSFISLCLLSACATRRGALQKSAAYVPIEEVAARAPVEAEAPSLPRAEDQGPYQLGIEDVIEISVYGNEDLGNRQAIRPDGKIAMFPIGDMQADGLTVDELRRQIEENLARIVKDPMVNVVVAEYNSRKVALLGALERPGVLRLRSHTSLVEGISLMGGFNGEADLERAMFIRGDELLPVSFTRLFRAGDFTQNVSLQPRDVVFIPNRQDNKVYVIGEVSRPGVVTGEGALTLLKAVALAGGYTANARADSVVIIRGGLSSPSIYLVDAQRVFKEGALENNIALATGDVVFVPQTTMASAERYLQFARNLLSPIVLGESAILLGYEIDDRVNDRIRLGGSSTSISVSP